MAAVGLTAVAGVIAASVEGGTSGSSDNWSLAFEEQFGADSPAGSFLDTYGSRWTAYDGLSDTSGIGRYSQAAISVHDGLLDLAVGTVAGQPTVAAPIPLVNGSWGGQVYGRYDVVFRSDELPGYKMAFLLWPDSDNWADGEIDFPEVGSLAAGQTAYANVYRVGDRSAGTPGPNAGFPGTVVPSDGAWHTATIVWKPSGVSFVLDGAVLGTVTDGIPDSAMHWVLQVETAIGVGAPDPAVAGSVQVDQVRQYRYTPTPIGG